MAAFEINGVPVTGWRKCVAYACAIPIFAILVPLVIFAGVLVLMFGIPLALLGIKPKKEADRCH